MIRPGRASRRPCESRPIPTWSDRITRPPQPTRAGPSLRSGRKGPRLAEELGEPLYNRALTSSVVLPSAGRSALPWQQAVPAFAIIVAGVGARLAWLAFTNFTFEDAFITFQFARRLAAGEGFVYNSGEPIYGTTTPLFALLVAGWLKVFPGNVVFGARLFDLLACTASLALTWAVLGRAGVAAYGRLCALALLAISDKL